jgi:predicted KAP-like P-loop ATPase
VEEKARKKLPVKAPVRRRLDAAQRAPDEGLAEPAEPEIAVQKFESSSAQERTDPSIGSTEQVGSSSDRAWDRILLAARGATRFYAALDDRAWRRPVDAMVIPCNSQGPGGWTLQRLSADVGPVAAQVLRRSLEASFKSRSSSLSPGDPFLCALPEELATSPVPRVVIGATVDGAFPITEANAATAAAAILRLAEKNHLRRVAIPLLGAGSGGLAAERVGPAMLRAILEAAPRGSGVEEITLVTSSQTALAAMNAVCNQRSQGFTNDLARGDDLLDMEAECFALAETLLLRDVKPPLVTGIFGGWGSGKSFAMHLMQQRISEIRSLPVPADQAWPEEDETHEERGVPSGVLVQPGETRAAKAPFPWVGHSYIVHFDAWTFAKSNLWASLMQAIFHDLNAEMSLETELSRIGIDAREGGNVWRVLLAMNEAERNTILKDELGREQLKKVRAADTTGDRLWQELREQKQVEREKLKKLEVELVDGQMALEHASAELTRKVDAEIDAAAHEDAWKALEGVLRDKAIPLAEALRRRVLGPSAADGKAAGSGIPSSLGFFRLNAQQLFIGLVVAVVLALLPYLFATLERWIQHFLGGLGVLTTVIGTTLAGWRRWEQLVNEGLASYEKRLEAARASRVGLRDARIKAALETQRKRALAGQDDSDNVAVIEHRIAELSARVGQQRQRAGVTAEFSSLAEFFRARIANDVYEKELGLMHRIQQDLIELTDALLVHKHDVYADAKKKLFPRGPARVFLFIDDLDRCPPARVVEVLEAAQLLVKTPLFVVILAMDDRYVTRALEKAYTGVLTRQGDPSGLDYIEKIIQIPYRVRKLAGGAVSNYLSAQMQVQRGGGAQPAQPGAPAVPALPGGITAQGSSGPAPSQRREQPAAKVRPPPHIGVLPTQVLVFSEEEFENLRSACDHTDQTPRAVKRMVNVYKLLKILWYRPNSHPKPEPAEERVMVVLLALSGRYPDLMRPVLEDLATKVSLSDQSFCVYFEMMQQNFPDKVVEREWKQALRAVHELIPPSFTLGMMCSATFQLVRSFCFVGDIGYEPGERTQLTSPALQLAADPAKVH